MKHELLECRSNLEEAEREQLKVRKSRKEMLEFTVHEF